MFFYKDKIDIYKIKENIVFQSMDKPNVSVKASVGSFVIVKGEKVMAEIFDDDDKDNNFEMLNITSIFVESNPYFFEKLT